MASEFSFLIEPDNDERFDVEEYDLYSRLDELVKQQVEEREVQAQWAKHEAAEEFRQIRSFELAF